MRIGFDLDGVLYDFGNSVRRYLDSVGRVYGFKDDQPEPHDWNFFEYWGMDYPEFKQICNDGADAGFVFCGTARPGAVETVKRVKELGHQIIVITDRQFGSTPKVSHDNTINWWNINGFVDFDEIHFSADKTVAPTDMFVEDKIENYDALIANGTPTYLINRPWNQVAEGDARARIDDIIDYGDAIEQVTKVQKYLDLSFV